MLAEGGDGLWMLPICCSPAAPACEPKAAHHVGLQGIHIIRRQAPLPPTEPLARVPCKRVSSNGVAWVWAHTCKLAGWGMLREGVCGERGGTWGPHATAGQKKKREEKKQTARRPAGMITHFGPNYQFPDGNGSWLGGGGASMATKRGCRDPIQRRSQIPAQ